MFIKFHDVSDVWICTLSLDVFQKANAQNDTLYIALCFILLMCTWRDHG